MPLSLEPVEAAQIPVLCNLMQLYLHETSGHNPRVIQDCGLFDTVLWSEGLQTGCIKGYIIRVKGQLAGFAIVQPRIQNGRVVAHTLTELFLLQNYRGFGIGEEIARILFDSHVGQWQVTVDPQNECALKFWGAVLYRYTGDNFHVTNWKDQPEQVFEFRSPSPRPTVEELRGREIHSPGNTKPQST